MNGSEFLAELDRRLSSVPKAERSEILFDYEAHLRAAAEDGREEAEVVRGLGNPKTIAKEILADRLVRQAHQNRNVMNVMRAVLAVISLGFFNVVFIAGPFVALVSILFTFYLISVILIVSPFIIGFRLLIGANVGITLSSPMAALFAVMVVEGLGILLTIVSILFSKGFVTALLSYLRFNLRIIKGEN